MFASRVKTLINAGIGPEQTNVLSNYEKANKVSLQNLVSVLLVLLKARTSCI